VGRCDIAPRDPCVSARATAAIAATGASVRTTATTYGTIGIGVILFLETGLLVGLVLPGETLTILAGAYSRGGGHHPHPQLALVIAAAALGAVAGGQCGYLIGRVVGPRLFQRADGRIFKREYVERTRHHFARFGSRTILIARFIPFVRTLASPAAGMGAMEQRRFAALNLAGGLVWAVTVALIGYVLGGLLRIDRYTALVTLGIVAASLTPLLVHRVRAGRGGG